MDADCEHKAALQKNSEAAENHLSSFFLLAKLIVEEEVVSASLLFNILWINEEIKK